MVLDRIKLMSRLPNPSHRRSSSPATRLVCSHHSPRTLYAASHCERNAACTQQDALQCITACGPAVPSACLSSRTMLPRICALLLYRTTVEH